MPRSYEALSASWVAASSAMVATLQPRPYDRIINRIAIVGPASSTFTMYRGFVVDNSFIQTQTSQGQRNVANLTNPIIAFANETMRMLWTGGSTVSTSSASITLWYDWELADGH